MITYTTKSVPACSYYAEDKVIEWKEVDTPFGRVRVLLLEQKPEVPAFGTLTIPEIPEQMVAEFVDGNYKGLHMGYRTKTDYVDSIGNALNCLFADMARRVANEIEGSQIRSCDYLDWYRPVKDKTDDSQP